MRGAMTNDEYLQSQVMPILQPGEQVLHSAYMVRQPGLAMQMLVIGGLLLFLITKAYFVVLTNRRVILVRTKMKFWSAGPQQLNLGVEQWDIRNIRQVTVSGMMNNRSMTFHMNQGPAETLRISPWFKKVAGTPAFFEQVPNLLSSGQLQQMALSAPPLPQLTAGAPAGAPPHMAQQQGGGGPPMQQQMQQPMGGPPGGAPPQQQMQMQQAPMNQSAGGFQPGSRVMVTGQDGNRYPATVQQMANGQYLCAMPNGQAYWIPQQNVSAS
jgi:hypothetical protein